MRIAIVGAGTLGWAYGSRLAKLAGCDVTLVGAHPEPRRVVTLERANTTDVLEWTSAVVADVPTADVLFSAVRYEHLEAMADRVASVSAPIVVLTPMMPHDHARLSTKLGGRLIAAMPSVVGYWSSPAIIRYWIPRTATTLIEAQSPPGIDAELVVRLERAGIASRLARNVLERNVATTLSFLPFAFGLDIANGVTPMLRDSGLLSLVLEAVEEGRALGQRVGAMAPWASILATFMRPVTLKIGVAMVQSRAPEVLSYANEHFGRKLHTQNIAMAEAMLRFAREKDAKRSALEKVFLRLCVAPRRPG